MVSEKRYGTSGMTAAMAQVGASEVPTGPMADVAKKARRAKAQVASAVVEDPVAELRQLRLTHQFMTKQKVRLDHMRNDKKLASGETWVNPIPPSVKSDLGIAQKSVERGLNEISARFEAELRKVPIYKEFLSRSYGGRGAVVATYLVTSIDIRKCEKPGHMARYCGNVPDPETGMLERRKAAPKANGGTGSFNQGLRTMLHLLDDSMSRNAAKFTACEAHEAQRPKKGAKKAEKEEFRAAQLACPDCLATEYPYGKTSKYLQVKEDYLVRAASSPRIDWAKNTITDFRTGKTMTNTDGRTPRSAAQFVFQTARRKMLDVFLEDLYVVWRALEGLPVWPDWYAGKLGYSHGGKIRVDAPKMLTLEEAKALVGDPGGRARTGMFVRPARLAEEEDDVAAE